MIGHRVGTAIVAGLLLAAPLGAAGQEIEETGVRATGLLLRQLDGVKRVLMIGAHPDDEDTAMLTVLARDLGAETAYLSLTRGDGGQNLIGSELWEGLGLIRTGELVAARRIDGGRQFFTRAFDFGYSKTAEESLTLWPHEEILGDVVWVVRSFRPHVIVTVWSGTPADRHGQHQASGILAREAFEAAGDPERFPDHLRRGVEPWTPLKLFQTVRFRPDGETVALEAGALDPLLGRSPYQVAMQSRSQHRSQDMGAPQPMGPRLARAALVESRVGGGAEQGLFEGIDTTLTGLADALPQGSRGEVRAHLDAYREEVARAREVFSLDTGPTAERLLAALGHLRAAMEAASGAADAELRTALPARMERTVRAYLAAAGIVTDVRAADDLVVPGDEVAVEVSVWNGGDTPLRGVSAALDLPAGWTAVEAEVEGVAADGSIPGDRLARWTFRVRVPRDAELSRPYFLREERDGDIYRWPDDHSLWGLPGNPAAVHASVGFDAGAAGLSTRVALERPWRYVGVDQARGEYDEPVLVVPAVSARVSPEAVVWPQASDAPRAVSVAVSAYTAAAVRGSLALEAPAGWRVEPARHAFELDGAGAERSFSFTLRPVGAPEPGEHHVRAVATLDDGRRYDETVALIDYEHIDRVARFTPAESRVTVVPVRVAEGLRVGYVMGTGDDGPEAIRQLGAEVTLLGPDAVRDGDFGRFDVLVVGVRAYETRDDLIAANAQILDFARAGGTVVVQYNQYQFARGGYAPYRLDILRPADRVSDETAPVTVLRPSAPVFTTPNRITQADFAGWSQERGLYFAGEWDDRFVPLLEMSDPGEEPTRGSLLVASVGEGVYVYTGLSFFRQFPSGVPGAYRLFANLLSLKADDWNRFLADANGR